jgi:hypothetical protein
LFRLLVLGVRQFPNRINQSVNLARQRQHIFSQNKPPHLVAKLDEPP